MHRIKTRNMVKAVRQFLILFTLCLSVFHSVGTEQVAAEDNTAEKSIVIPPPPKGVEPSYGPKPQELEKNNISIMTAQGQKYDFVVEIAKTPMQQKKGMMFRKAVPDRTGMLFLFDKEKERQFWMQNTWVPLDIIFIRRDGVITHIHHEAKAESTDLVKSNGPAFAVLEILGGESKKLKINIGDRVEFSAFNFSEDKE